MKYKYIFSALAAMGLLATGCSDVDFISKSQGTNNKKVTLSAETGATTRLAFEEQENGRVKLSWTGNDYLHVIDPDGKQVTKFTLDDGIGESRADFSGIPDKSYTDGQTLLALFTKNDSTPIQINQERDGVYIDLSGQDGTLNEKYQYMYGKTTYHDKGATYFHLQNLVSVIKANIQLPDGVKEVKHIQFRDRNNDYRSNAYMMLHDGSFGDNSYQAGDLLRVGYLSEVYRYDENGGFSEQTIQGEDEYDNTISLHGSFLPTDNTLSNYFYVMPVKQTKIRKDTIKGVTGYQNLEDRRRIRPEMIISDSDGKVYIARSNNGKNVEAGTIYHLNIQAEEMPVIPENVQTVLVPNDNGQAKYYAFTPKETGIYQLNCTQGTIYLESYGGSNNHIIDFAAGTTYLMYVFGNTKVTISKIPELTQDEPASMLYAVDSDNNRHIYAIYPKETGIYTFEGLSDGDRVNCASGSHTHMDGNTYILYKDKIFSCYLRGNDKQEGDSTRITLRKKDLVEVSTGTTPVKLTPYDSQNNRYYYKINVPKEGIYHIILPVGLYDLKIEDSYDWYYGNGMNTDSISERVVGLRPDYTTYLSFIAKRDETNFETILTIEKIKSVTESETFEVAENNVFTINAEQNGGFYKISGLQCDYIRSTGFVISDNQYYALSTGQEAIFQAKYSGTLKIEKLDTSNAIDITTNQNLEAKAGQVYRISVGDKKNKPLTVYTNDDARLLLLETNGNSTCGAYIKDDIINLTSDSYYLIPSKDTKFNIFDANFSH